MPIDPEGKKSWIKVLPGLPNPSELLRKMKPPVPLDPYIGSTDVAELDKASFRHYISHGECVLVMFYDPSEEKCAWSKDQFVKAAEVKLGSSQTFAAVDLSKNAELCASEHVDAVPYFKLYHKGRSVCFIREYQQLSANVMLKLLDNAEVISAPTEASEETEKSFCGALIAVVENLPLKSHCQLAKRTG
ncbi:hypothetical protein BsWGS_17034 [Bradybaena similaris]